MDAGSSDSPVHRPAGMSGYESCAEARALYDVNVRGSANVIAACLKYYVPRLV